MIHFQVTRNHLMKNSHLVRKSPEIQDILQKRVNYQKVENIHLEGVIKSILCKSKY
jgi:hypothetical protein